MLSDPKHRLKRVFPFKFFCIGNHRCLALRGMKMTQTTLDDFEDVLAGTLKWLVAHPRVLEFIERVLNDYVPPPSVTC